MVLYDIISLNEITFISFYPYFEILLWELCKIIGFNEITFISFYV